MPKVSIIVPVYNVKEYLCKCLDSILAQTLSDFEVICVDDGSNDGSEQIVDEYAQRDNRIKVLHRTNAGYGAAMNAGLDMASGQYIGIVESDDCVLPEMFEKLCGTADENAADFVKSDVFYWLESCNYMRRIHMKHLDHYYDTLLGDEDRNVFFDFFMNIWTGVYRKDFLDHYDIRFHESAGASYQDNGFWMQTMMYAKKAMWLNDAFYLYRNDNPTASVRNPGKIYAMTREYEYLEALLLKRGDYHLLPYCYYYRLFRHRGTFLRIADECKREYCEQIKADFLKYQSAMKGNQGFSNFLKKYVDDADTICESVVATKNRIYKAFAENENVIIYGAGVHGDAIFRALYNEGLYDKIKCFAVSQDVNEKVIAGKKVLLIRDALKKYPDGLVIVAVVRGTGAYQAMVEMLQSLSCDNYFDGTDMEETFYIL